MHLHLGIPKDDLPELECHQSVLNFDHPVADEQNMSIISIPTVFDPSLAPDGYHLIISTNGFPFKRKQERLDRVQTPSRLRNTTNKKDTKSSRHKRPKLSGKQWSA
jgi:phytoene dehydrogenase-like protein